MSDGVWDFGCVVWVRRVMCYIIDIGQLYSYDVLWGWLFGVISWCVKW